MPIKTKRWDDAIEADDGIRILICRYRPRAVRKEDEAWSEWLADLAPSEALHAAAYGKGGNPISWQTYRTMYLREMQHQKRLIGELARRVAGGATLTLLCSSAC